MRLRSQTQTRPHADAEVRDLAPSPDEVLDRLALRDWVWTALDELTPDDRLTVLLRHFTRSCSYDAIAAVTGVPVGTVRSRLSRSRRLLASALEEESADPILSRKEIERSRLAEWEGFYAEVHERPTPHTYRATYALDVEVTDRNGRWQGVREWSDHERQAITLGVRARIVGLIASRDITVVEIDFTNPDWASDHCPPRSTFVHRLSDGRSQRLDIHYV
jgi:Sigma-70, region 4